MVVLGYEDTTLVTLDEMLHHTRAVARGVQRALLVADMPIHTYDTPEQAVANARALVDAGAQAVKFEGGVTPRGADRGGGRSRHSIHGAHRHAAAERARGRRLQVERAGRRAEAEALLLDAKAVEAAGAFAVVLEIVAAEAARQITAAIEIPTIGIGSGHGCDGQILVTHDLIGLFPWFTPKFVKQEADVAAGIRAAAAAFIARTRLNS